MKKRSKLLLVLTILVFLVMSLCFVLFLIKTSSFNRLVALLISSTCFILILFCFILVLIEERRELVDRNIGKYKFLVCDRDYSQDLRKMMDNSPISNSSEEAELLNKYEEMAIKYEKARNYYIVYIKEEPVALIEVNRNFKEKEISFNVVFSKLKSNEQMFELISKEENMKIKLD